MTCIVAVKSNKKVYIGGDSAAVAELSVNTRKDSKVFINGKFIIGFAGSFRLGQIMRFHFTPPRHLKSKDDYDYMCTDFIKRMQKTLEDNGFSGENKRSEKETSGQMLVGYNGELYEIYEDYQVGIVHDPYNAIGSGGEIALGSLHTTHTIENRLTPNQKITAALDAASRYNAGVLPPYNILSL